MSRISSVDFSIFVPLCMILMLLMCDIASIQGAASDFLDRPALFTGTSTGRASYAELIIPNGNSNPIPIGNADRTITAWIRATSAPQDLVILGMNQQSGGCGPTEFDLQFSIFGGNNLCGGICNQACLSGPASVPVNINTWYHIAVTYTASTGKGQTWVNGQAGTASALSPSTSADHTVIGGRWSANNPTQASALFEGEIGTVNIYNRVLTSSEIGADLNLGGASPNTISFSQPTGLVISFGFNTQSSTYTILSSTVPSLSLSLMGDAHVIIPTTITGDPLFIGLQGQSYQIHGIPDEIFNLVSYPDMQLNSKFVYLDSGSCTYNNTACWTHPGTYNSELGFMFPNYHIHLISGSHNKGCQLKINNYVQKLSSLIHITNNITIKYQEYDTIDIITPLFTWKITNSDYFFNLAFEMHSIDLLLAGRRIHHIKDDEDISVSSSSPYPYFPLHGLIGQTWRNARYGKNNKLYQGLPQDYLVQDGLWGTKFDYNTYKY